MKTLIAVAITNNHVNFKNIVKDLNNQSKFDFDVIVWNNINSPNASTYLEAYMDRSVNYRIKIINSKINIYSFGAYVATNMVLNNNVEGYLGGDYDKIIVIEDDARLDGKLIEYMNDSYLDKYLLGTDSFVVVDEFTNKIKSNKEQYANYCSGAVIFSSELINDEFIKNYNYGYEFINQSSIQLSKYAKSNGYHLRGLDSNLYDHEINHNERAMPNNQQLQMNAHLNNAWKVINDYYYNK